MVALGNQFTWSLDNVNAVNAAFDRLSKEIDDFSIPFMLIASDFYRSQRQLFTLQSAGRYIDLSPKYKPVKLKKVGFIYPILVGSTRRLSNSSLGKDHADAIFILTPKQLTIGSSTPYLKYHQSDAPRSKIPQRKLFFINGGPNDKASDGKNGRRERWINIIDTHIHALINGV